MLINPSMFFPEVKAEVWTYFPPVAERRPFTDVICICGVKHSLEDWANAPIKNTIIQCQIAIMIHNKEKIAFWQGLCNKCKRCYWTCENFNWIPWLTELQTVEMLYSAIPVKHLKLDGCSTGDKRIITHSGTVLDFLGGKLERVS